MANADRTSAASRRKKPRPTQQDIANALGLGQSTVATALNPEQRHRLQEATVERVLACAKSLGYRGGVLSQIDPLPPTRSKVRSSKPVIALVENVGFDKDIFNELTNAFNRYDVYLVPVQLQWFDRDGQQFWEYLSDYELSGVVLYNLVQPVEAETVRRCIPAEIPLVALHCSLNDVISLKSNIEEIFVRIGMLHLKAGAKKLGLLLSPRDPGVMIPLGWTMQGRIKGFMTALHNVGGKVLGDQELIELVRMPGMVSEDGVKFKDTDLCQGRIYYHVCKNLLGGLQEHGYHVGARLIEEKALPDVMFCGNDAIAAGFLCACMDHGVKVPEDVAIWGCEDTDWGRFAAVPLASVFHPRKMIARETSRTMMDLVEKRADPTIVYEKYLPVGAIVRESAGDLDRLKSCLDELPSAYERSFHFAEGRRVQASHADK